MESGLGVGNFYMNDVFINDENIQKFAECFNLSKEEVEVIKRKIYLQRFLNAVYDTIREESKGGE